MQCKQQNYMNIRHLYQYAAFAVLFILTGCVGTGLSTPWSVEDYRRPAQGAPNQLSKSSLSNPDLFYANQDYSVQQIANTQNAAAISDNDDRSNIPYQRFEQTLQDFSRAQKDSGQRALAAQEQRQKQAFLGAKLPQDPGVAPSIQTAPPPSNAHLNKDDYPAIDGDNGVYAPNQAQYQGQYQDQAQPSTARQSNFFDNLRNLGRSNKKSDDIRVALLVPLTGEHSHIGQAMLKASEIAIFNLGIANYHILPRDTKGTQQGARLALRSAIDDGADVVIGPLFTQSTRAIKSIARSNNLKVFSFTTDWRVADNNTFTMGFLPFSQVQKIMEHAAAQGLRRIGVLAPDNDYGQAVIHAYQNTAAQLGLETVNIVRYPLDSANISPVIKEFTHYDERAENLKLYLASLEQELELQPDNIELQKEIESLQGRDTYGESPYDAVLLPIGGEQAKAIANLLSFYDLDPDQVVRLGTGLWDDLALATEPNMAGGRFAASSPDARKSFINQYRQLYGVEPPRLASLAYDATSLTAVLGRGRLLQGASDTDLFKLRDITNPNGFAGIDGIFRFHPDGLIERGLAILNFTARKDIAILEPAPATFEHVTDQAASTTSQQRY